MPNGKQCKAKSKRTGKHCRANCVTGRDVCYHHGGMTPTGLASPNTKHGLYSSHLPTKLSTQYQELLTLGQDLFRIDDETAVLTSLVQQQLGKIEDGESSLAWNRLQSLYDEMSILAQKPDKSQADVQKFNSLFGELGKVINSGTMAYAARDETIKLIEQKRKMVADERKNWSEKHKAMSFDRVLLLMTAMAASFKQSLEVHIDDDKSRRVVLSDTQKFLDKVLSE